MVKEKCHMDNDTSFDTPILFLIFNRPETTLKVFEKIRLLRPRQLFVAADGPRSGSDSDFRNCASACGTPVAAFAGTGHDSTIIHKETGYLAKMGDYADLARGICYLPGKDNRQIGQTAQTFVHDTFSPRQIAEQWKEILETGRRTK